MAKKDIEFMKMGNASKPVSLHPLKVGAALAGLLQVKPPVKPAK